MTHELTFSADGVANMFSVGETAWHNEGHLLTVAPSLDAGLDLMEAGYTVETRPVMFEGITPSGDRYAKSYKGQFVTVRTDTNEPLGVVGSTYRVVQNADAFRVLEPLLDSGVAKLETGGVLRDGADAWLMVRWAVERFGPKVQEVFGSELVPFGLMATNHSGRRGTLLQDTNVRVVCANTLNFAESKGAERRVVVRHSSIGMDRIIEAARTMFHDVIERYDVLATQYETLQRTMLTAEQFRKLVLDPIAPLPQDSPKFNPEAPKAQLVMDRAETKRSYLTDMWSKGKGHTGEPSAWYAYNAVVESLDHNKDLWPTRGGAWRAASLMDGKLREHKDTALHNLLKFSQSGEAVTV